ncbi:hypothetical protein BKA69DRAFT_1089174 [Paraphysoderma sedebokerense]|nr:hypothetical protein BKA69DRAFT_1089174 [Paraphysoderma sedebokerense]
MAAPLLSSLRRSFASEASSAYKLVLLGAGCGGLSVSNSLAPILKGEKLAIIEPSEKHYYQPLWTFVGGGVKPFSDSVKPTSELIPKEVDWIKDKAVKVDPENKLVKLGSGQTIKYDYLVIATGIQTNWDKIKGLPEALGKDGVTSNYDAGSVQKTWDFINTTNKGNAIFTMPSTPVKCAGAPQKIMYLAEEQFREKNVRDQVNVQFYSGIGKIFAIDKYANSLTDVYTSRNIQPHFFHDLTAIDAANKIATFKNVNPNKAEADQDELKVEYNLLHVTPPMGPPAWVKESGLSDAAGWVDVNKETLQHNKYPNIFSLGDVSSVPTSKTAAAVAAESGVLESNLLAVMSGATPRAKYDGYTSCPLVTGRGKLILAEFSGFTGQPQETFPVDQGKERSSMYYLTSEVIPEIYWHGLVKGRWKGPSFFREFWNTPTSSQ